MLILFPYKRYATTISEKVAREATCEKCGCRYRYLARIRVVGYQDSGPVGLFGKSAASSSQRIAQKKLEKKKYTADAPAPCPQCLNIRQSSLRKYRLSHYKAVFVIAGLLMFGGGLFCGSEYLPNGMFHGPDAELAIPGMIPGMALLGLSLLLMVFTILLMVYWPVNPDACRRMLTDFAVEVIAPEPATPPTTNGKAVSSSKPMATTQAFQTNDFAISLPLGWTTMPSQSKAGLYVYQAADGNAQLTLSVAADIVHPDSKDGRKDITQISTIRRNAETETANLQLTDAEISGGDMVWSSKWRGSDPTVGRQTATLVQLAKSKLFTLYIENLDAPEAASNAQIAQIISSFIPR